MACACASCGGVPRRRVAEAAARVPCPCALLLSTTHIPLTRAAHPAPPATETAAPVTPPPLRPGRPAPGPRPPRRLPPRYFPKFFPAAPKGQVGAARRAPRRQVHPTERVRGPARKAEFAAAPLAAAAPLWPVNPCVFPSCGPRVGLPSRLASDSPRGPAAGEMQRATPGAAEPYFETVW